MVNVSLSKKILVLSSKNSLLMNNQVLTISPLPLQLKRNWDTHLEQEHISCHLTSWCWDLIFSQFGELQLLQHIQKGAINLIKGFNLRNNLAPQPLTSIWDLFLNYRHFNILRSIELSSIIQRLASLARANR